MNKVLTVIVALLLSNNHVTAQVLNGSELPNVVTCAGGDVHLLNKFSKHGKVTFKVLQLGFENTMIRWKNGEKSTVDITCFDKVSIHVSGNAEFLIMLPNSNRVTTEEK